MKISIITASYNSGKTIRHTVESVLRQTYPDYEYIVVDGGSTDNSIDVVKEYQVGWEFPSNKIDWKQNGVAVGNAETDIQGIQKHDSIPQFTKCSIIPWLGIMEHFSILKTVCGSRIWVQPKSVIRICLDFMSLEGWILFGF